MADRTVRATACDSARKLDGAIARGEFYRLRPDGERDPFPAWADVPDWVPRKGYTAPTRALLVAVRAGLRRKL
ncbi:hypothetical protein AB0D46_02530 [Streptomyces sp. NPDC048383]|uniref:hypothetical protein n=1 Tax=Streptomyces sp. NPDC048383 TaxID=3155386 RepID=UPI0034477C0F